MTAFEFANWFAVFVGGLAFVLVGARIKIVEVVLVLLIFIVLIPFALVSSFAVLFNVAALFLFTVVSFSAVQLSRLEHSAVMPLNLMGVVFLFFLFVAPVVLRKADGWLVLLGVASKYWFLFFMALLYSVCSNNYRTKALIAIVVFCAGVVWGFKAALLLFLFMLIHYAATGRSLKGLVVLCFWGVVSAGLAYVFLYDQILDFLESSVLRPNYKYDTKIFGFSDGARINIWLHYLQNSVWFGKGGYDLPDVVASHNVFVHLVHELGVLGFMLVAPFFLMIFVLIALRVGVVFAGFFVISLNLSSVGEYACMWVFCVVFVPLLLRSDFFHKRIALVRINYVDV